jgi:hypothetical protein
MRVTYPPWTTSSNGRSRPCESQSVTPMALLFATPPPHLRQHGHQPMKMPKSFRTGYSTYGLPISSLSEHAVRSRNRRATSGHGILMLSAKVGPNQIHFRVSFWAGMISAISQGPFATSALWLSKWAVSCSGARRSNMLYMVHQINSVSFDGEVRIRAYTLCCTINISRAYSCHNVINNAKFTNSTNIKIMDTGPSYSEGSPKASMTTRVRRRI